MLALPTDYTPSPLELLQRDLAARLASDPFFATIPVYVMRPRGAEGFIEIQQRIEQTLQGLIKTGGKTGAAVRVLMPTADATDPDAPGPRLDFALSVRVEELPTVNMGPNGTRKSAEEIALKVLALGHLFSPGRGAPLVAAPDALTPRPDPQTRVLAIDCQFTQKTGLGCAGKVSRPTVSPAAPTAGATVTLTCPTAGATIRYTLDGSYPGAANAAALVYGAPFTAAAGTLRTAAEKTGLVQSDLVELAVAAS